MDNSLTAPQLACKNAIAIVLLAVLLCLPVTRVSAAVDLKPLITAPGTTVILESDTVYSVGEVWLYTDKTILCNGALIQSSGGPIRASSPGMTLTVDNCNIQGNGWALLAAASNSKLVVRNASSLTGNGNNTCIYVGSSTLDFLSSSIDQCKWGINMENADASIHSAAITNSQFGIQNVAGHVFVGDNSNLQNINEISPGVGVSLIASSKFPSRRSSAVIRDSTFTGFGNAVDIQPTAAKGLLGGTVDITESTFYAQYWSALAAVDAVDVLFSSNRVINAITDGIYLVNSTGVIENSEVLNSLNTGVTFWGCPNGAILRNSLVSGSAHQGVGIVADYIEGRASHNVQIVGNTFKENVIADILVDELSDAAIQGNIFTGSPGASVRLHGSHSSSLTGDLFYDAAAGLEIKEGAYANGTLSIFARHDNYGTLIYDNAMADLTYSAFQDNGLIDDSFSIFINSGGQINLENSSLGPAGRPGLYNNSENTITANNNWWSDSNGPQLPNENIGEGATLNWTAENGSYVAYQPFLSSPQLDDQINDTFNLQPGVDTLWSTDLGLSLSLSGEADTTEVPNGLAAVLRLTDTSGLTVPFPPQGTFADGIITVWAEYDLLSRSQSGSLRFQTDGHAETAKISRLQADHCWEPLSTSWDPTNSEIVYSPSDPSLLSGVFAIGTELPDQQTQARLLIESFYLDILGRAPEAGAVDSWFTGYFQFSISLGIDVRFVFREMARVFFSSAEYKAMMRTDEQFIRDNYQVFLRRIPSQWEMDRWMNGSWSRPEVVSSFAESTEFGAYVRGLFTCHGGIPVRNFVTTIYIGLLDRLIDEGGLLYYENVLNSAFSQGGVTGARTAAKELGSTVIASTEYQSTSPTSETHVIRLYRAYLGRYPASNELSYWVKQLDGQQQTPTSIINTFAESPEFTSLLNDIFGLH